MFKLAAFASPFLAAVLAGASSAEPAAEPPNIVLIVADDLGFSDLGCYGGEAETPRLDRLAAEGVRFSRFRNGAKCEPTRAALMTGHRNTPEIGFYGERAETFLPEVLRDLGYRTMLSGKWHVGGHPLDRGFDRFFGHEEGASNYWTGSGRLQLDRQPYEPGPDYFSTDTFTDFALGFLEESKSDHAGKPFFLYLAYTAPHDPLQAPEADIAKYRGNYMEGYHRIKKQRWDRVRDLGLVPPGTRRTQWPQNVPRWESLNQGQRETEDYRMATYSAMTDRMDQQIGRVIEWLEAHGEYENTLIVFISDNGANPFDRGSEAMVKAGIPPGGPESRWTLGTAWAHVSNTPFRLYKRNQHEGGICSPMILHWPEADYAPGSVSELPVHVLDFLPSLHAIAGGSGRPPGIEGEDLSALWRTGAEDREYGMMGYLVDHRYIQDGHWKLVAVDGGPWELYNLAEDRTETNDLADTLPGRVEEMALRWQEWYDRVDGRPFADPDEPGERLRRRLDAHLGDRGSGSPYRPVELPGNVLLNLD